MDDVDLLNELSINPQKGMETVTDQYAKLVYSIINSKIATVGTVEDVKECVSDVLIEFYRHVNEIDLSRCSIKGYLAVVAKHKGIDLYRKLIGNTERFVCLDEKYEYLKDNKLNPEQEVIRKEEKKILLNAIESLGEPDKEIFIRKYFMGQKTKEIAETLYLRDNTVDKKISRGLKKLRVLLGGVNYEGSEDISNAK